MTVPPLIWDKRTMLQRLKDAQDPDAELARRQPKPLSWEQKVARDVLQAAKRGKSPVRADLPAQRSTSGDGEKGS